MLLVELKMISLILKNKTRKVKADGMGKLRKVEFGERNYGK